MTLSTIFELYWGGDACVYLADYVNDCILVRVCTKTFAARWHKVWM